MKEVRLRKEDMLVSLKVRFYVRSTFHVNRPAMTPELNANARGETQCPNHRFGLRISAGRKGYGGGMAPIAPRRQEALTMLIILFLIGAGTKCCRAPWYFTRHSAATLSSDPTRCDRCAAARPSLKAVGHADHHLGGGADRPPRCRRPRLLTRAGEERLELMERVLLLSKLRAHHPSKLSRTGARVVEPSNLESNQPEAACGKLGGEGPPLE